MSKLVFRGETVDLGSYSLGNSVKGYVYVCPHCGELWGKLEMGGVGVYIINGHPCENHSESWIGRPGSFLNRLRWGDYSQRDLWKNIEALPDGLLRHEALMLANEILTTKETP